MLQIPSLQPFGSLDALSLRLPGLRGLKGTAVDLHGALDVFVHG